MTTLNAAQDWYLQCDGRRTRLLPAGMRIGLRDVVRDQVVENLAAEDAVLVIDETGFLKQGKASCGVWHASTRVPPARSRTTGSALFAAYVSRHGHALIDRALYLPKSWTSGPARLAATHVPEGTAFPTEHGKGYVLGVKSDHHFGSWHGKLAVAGRASEIARDVDHSAWQRLSEILVARREGNARPIGSARKFIDADGSGLGAACR